MEGRNPKDEIVMLTKLLTASTKLRRKEKLKRKEAEDKYHQIEGDNHCL